METKRPDQIALSEKIVAIGVIALMVILLLAKIFA
jgi:hypothetical protein